jgi:hypothetical protein
MERISSPVRVSFSSSSSVILSMASLWQQGEIHSEDKSENESEDEIESERGWQHEGSSGVPSAEQEPEVECKQVERVQGIGSDERWVFYTATVSGVPPQLGPVATCLPACTTSTSQQATHSPTHNTPTCYRGCA